MLCDNKLTVWDYELYVKSVNYSLQENIKLRSTEVHVSNARMSAILPSDKDIESQRWIMTAFINTSTDSVCSSHSHTDYVPPADKKFCKHIH